jgi:hypothetical protein
MDVEDVFEKMLLRDPPTTDPHVFQAALIFRGMLAISNFVHGSG